VSSRSREVRNTWEALLSNAGFLYLIVEGERKMIDFNNIIRERRIVTMFFALLAGISAVSTAVAPGIVHI
jgi:hypothetical protein